MISSGSAISYYLLCPKDIRQLIYFAGPNGWDPMGALNKQSKIYLKHRTRFYRMMPDVEFKCPMNGTLVNLGDDNNEITMS